VKEIDYQAFNPFLVPSPEIRGRMPASEVQQAGRGYYCLEIKGHLIFQINLCDMRVWPGKTRDKPCISSGFLI
jgi:hypothetical protein